jgi:TnpA family transposase
MIEGLLRHSTDMTIEKNYVDTHGQSEVAFAFCHLLGLHLMPRFKAIHSQKLYRPEAGMPYAYPHLQPALTRPINLEIQEGLNVIENWNSANSFIFYGKGGEIQTNQLEDQEVAVLALHLLQNCLVFINTLMIQEVLMEDDHKLLSRLYPEDFRALTPLIYSHVNPYGTLRLNMKERLSLGNMNVS